MRIPSNVNDVVASNLYSIDETLGILKCCRTTLRKYTRGALIMPTMALDGRTYYSGASIINFCHGKMPRTTSTNARR